MSVRGMPRQPRDAAAPDVKHILDHLNHDDLITHPGVSAWQDLVPDPGWFSVLRYRMTPLGVQLEGAAQPSGTGVDPGVRMERIGVLAPGYRPLPRLEYLTATVFATAPQPPYTFGVITIDETGAVSTQWQSVQAGGGTYVVVNGVFPID